MIIRGFKRLKAAVQRREKNVREVATQNPMQVGSFMARMATLLAPEDTGATKQAIRFEGGASRSVVRLIQPQQNRRQPRPYHMWMHGLNPRSDAINIRRFQSRIYTGDPQFMFTATEHARKYDQTLRNSKLNSR